MRRPSMLGRPIRLMLLGMLLIGASWLVIPHTAQAQTATPVSIESIGGQVGLADTDLKVIVIRVIKWFLGIVSLVSLVYVIYGGYVWLTSAGDEAKIIKAKRIILQACIGIVIILLSWAIVLFVQRTILTNIVNNGNNNDNTNQPCQLGDPSCTPAATSTLNITAIATCAAPNNYAQNVPRSSNVAVFFSRPIDSATAKKAVEDSKNMKAVSCTDASCGTTGSVKPLEKQTFALNAATATKDDPKTEWVTKSNSNAVTLIHQTFSQDVNSVGYRLFAANSTYQLQIPKFGATNAIVDTSPQQRPLQKCEAANGGPIPGDDSIAPNCHVDTPTNTIQWKFTTGTATDGPPMNVTNTVPSSAYLTNGSTSTPDRNVDTSAVLGIRFSTAVDPSSFEIGNMTVTKYIDPPTQAGAWKNGTVSGTPLSASDFTFTYRSDGTGAWLRLNPGKKFDAFTWYQVKVSGVRNLCGAAMQTEPYVWTFETNDVVPGVAKVYPANSFANACPSTKVVIIFNTSMWRGEGTNCNVGDGSYVTSGSLKSGSSVSGRNLVVQDPLNTDDPNQSCRVYTFDPTTTQLVPGQTYSAAVRTDLTIDQNGNKLEYGDGTSGKPWHFTVATAEQCVQPPLITRIAPSQGKDGQCISVLGNYFEKKSETTSDGKPESGDGLTLGTRNQLTDADVSWNDTSIVTTVDAGVVGQASSLARDQNYSYTVTVNYPAPIGALSDTSTYPFYLQSGVGSLGPCLRSLSKTSGPVGTKLSASGKRFGSFGSSSAVSYPLHPQGLEVLSGWSDTAISSLQVRADTATGSAPVQIIDQSGNSSNPIDFTTTASAAPGVGAPRVVEQTQCNLTASPNQIPSPNPRDGSTNICLTTKPEVWFTVAMNPTTLTAAGNITLSDCTTTPCTPVSGMTVTVRGDRKSIQLDTPKLTANHKYTVTISGDVESDIGAIRMGTDYTWTFTTQSGTADCPVTNVTINESSQIVRTMPFIFPLSSSIRTASCQSVTQANVQYTWSVRDGQVVTVTPSVNPANAVARSILSPVAATDQITVKADTKTSNPISITYDPTSCQTNSDCTTNSLGESCSSTCQNNRCTPVINSIDPNNGAPGTWTTVRGCWLGAYTEGSSKVVYGANQTGAKDGIAPNAQQCGAPSATWTNEWVIREVPAGAVTGTVQVVRSDGQTADSSGNYTVNATQYPGLCKITPSGAKAGALVTLNGIRFGTSAVAQQAQNATDISKPDAALYTSMAGGLQQALFPYPSWTATAVGTRLPSGIADGPILMSLKKGGVNSNKVPYTVGASSSGGTSCAQACSGDGDVCPNTAGGLKQGCSLTTFCCAVRPVVTSFQPLQGGTNICRNTLVSIGFSTPLQTTSISTNSIIFREGAVAKTISSVTVDNTATAGTVKIIPGLLGAGATESVTFAPNTLRGANGVLADLTGLPLNFTAGQNICTMDKLTIAPVVYTATAVAETNSYIASAWHGTTQLANIAGVYGWDWSWLSGNSEIMTTTAGGATPFFGVARGTAVGPGTTTVTVKAKVTSNATNANDKTQLSAKGKYVSDFCSAPWSFSDAANNCDIGGACNDYHFQLRYCRTNGTSTLPNFDYNGPTGVDLGSIEGANSTLGRLKTMFFKEEGESKKDIIGVLVYDNAGFLSPLDWFTNRFPDQTVSSSTYIAGYPAVQTGTTAYIGVTDINNGQPRGLMFVFDFNSNEAEGATKNIYSRMLASLEFNTNLGNDDDRLALQRDTQRRQDLAGVQALADAYKAKNGAFPALASGSYIPNYSMSKWPSWQATLGSDLGKALPTDPNNTFARHCSNDLTKSCVMDSQCSSGGTCSKPICTSPYDNATCWAETTKQFMCPKGSSVYLYRAQNGGLDLYANMEYTGEGAFTNFDPNQNACSGSGSNCACFNYRLSK